MIRRIALLGACSALGLAGLPGSAASQAKAPAQAKAPSQAATPSGEAAQKSYWQEQHRKVAEELAWARHAHDTAILTYDKRRQRQRLRGEKRAEVKEALKTTKARLEAAEEAMARFPEEARRAGALPGWFREAASEPVNLPQSPARPKR